MVELLLWVLALQLCEGKNVILVICSEDKGKKMFSKARKLLSVCETQVFLRVWAELNCTVWQFLSIAFIFSSILVYYNVLFFRFSRKNILNLLLL